MSQPTQRLTRRAPASADVAPYRVRFSAQETDEFLQRARAILTAGALVPGASNAELERAFAAFTGAAHATAVSSGTAALEIAFRCLGLPGKAVLLPANTNYATAEAAQRAGCRVALYDSGLHPSLEAIEAAWTPAVAAVVVVHIGGYLHPGLLEIVDFCRDRGVVLVEDASHAHGAALSGRGAGTFGDAAAFSMFATKVITTSEGGILTTGDGEIATASRRYRDQGKANDGLHNVLFGSAWRMSELHAALGLVQMPSLPAVLERVNAIARRYASGITHPHVSVPHDPSVRYSGHKLIVTVADGMRDSLRAHLLADGITPAKGVYEVPLHRQPILGLGEGQEYPDAERFAVDHLCLPLWKGISDAEVDRVIDGVNGWNATA